MLAALVTIIVIDLLVRALIDGIVANGVTEWPFNPAVVRMGGMVASRFAEVVGVLLALAILFRVTRYGSFADLGLSRGRLMWLPVGFVTPIIALVLAVAIAYVTRLLPVNRLLYPGPWPTWLALAAATQAAWVEEIAFRGVLMRGIERMTGRTPAIVISAAVFTLLHLLAPFQLSLAWWILVAAAGFGLGWAFYASGRSLWLTAGLHWGFDLGLFLLLGLPGETRGLINSVSLMPVPALSRAGGYVILIGTLLTALALFFLLHRKRQQEAAA